jgi:hypothetical protein
MRSAGIGVLPVICFMKNGTPRKRDVRLPRQQLVGNVGRDAARFVAQLGDRLFVAGRVQRSNEVPHKGTRMALLRCCIDLTQTPRSPGAVDRYQSARRRVLLAMRARLEEGVGEWHWPNR